jgi:hypothetical protein
VILQPGAAVHDLNFDLKEEAILGGRLLDAGRRPVTGATVMAWVKSTKAGETRFLARGFTDTDDTGSFRIEELGEGQYRLVGVLPPLKPRKMVRLAGEKKEEAVHQGSLRFAFYPNSPNWDTAAVQTIGYGASREGLDIILGQAPVHCVSVVVGSSTQPAAGAQSASLSVFAPIAASFLQVARGAVKTGEEWEVCGLPSGDYKAVATTFDPETKKATAFGKADFNIGKRDLELGQLMLVLDQGQFTIEGAFQDEFGVTVSGMPQGYYLREARQDGRDALRGTVRVGGGELVVTLGRDGPVLDGRTVDAEGHPVADVSVGLVSADSRAVYLTQADSAGRFQYRSGIAPGRYSLVALTGLWAGETDDPEIYRQQLSRSVTLDFGPNERKSQDFIAVPAAR